MPTDRADLEQITALTRKLKAKDIDPVAVVSAEVAKAVSAEAVEVEASPHLSDAKPNG